MCSTILPFVCWQEIIFIFWFSARKHIFILLTFLQGEILERFKYNQRVDVSLGLLLSQLHSKLKVT